MTNSLLDLTDLFAKISPNVPPDTTPLNTAVDPLALSCASYRAWIDAGLRWTDWSIVECNSSDHQMAADIRRFYRDQIALQALHGQPVSKFRSELYNICNGGTMQNCHRGMLYKLPYFYAEDTARHQLVAEFGDQVITNADHESLVETLTPVRTVFRSKRPHEFVEYWYRDSKNQLHMMDINYSHAYRPLTDSLYNLPQVRLKFYRYARTDRRTQLTYWGMIKVEVAA